MALNLPPPPLPRSRSLQLFRPVSGEKVEQRLSLAPCLSRCLLKQGEWGPPPAPAPSPHFLHYRAALPSPATTTKSLNSSGIISINTHTHTHKHTNMLTHTATTAGLLESCHSGAAYDSFHTNNTKSLLHQMEPRFPEAPR